jgi:hypothetical protein
VLVEIGLWASGRVSPNAVSGFELHARLGQWTGCGTAVLEAVALGHGGAFQPIRELTLERRQANYSLQQYLEPAGLNTGTNCRHPAVQLLASPGPSNGRERDAIHTE